MVFYRANDSSQAQVRPDNRSLPMAPQHALQFLQVGRRRTLLREGHVDIVVKEHDEARLRGEVEDLVKRRIEETGSAAGDFCRHELLVNGKFPDSGEDTGERAQDAADV